jgi:hypothetical protein
MDEMHQILMAALAKLLEATGVDELVLSDADMDDMADRGLTLKVTGVEDDPSTLVLSLGEQDFDGDIRVTTEDGEQVMFYG